MNYYITQYGPEDFAGKEMPEYLYGCDSVKVGDESRYMLFGDLHAIIEKIIDQDSVSSVDVIFKNGRFYLEW
jgi:hypothetical protein